MKRPYILLSSLLFFVSLNSCSVYRNNPTPDDVYYSPGTPAVSQLLLKITTRIIIVRQMIIMLKCGYRTLINGLILMIIIMIITGVDLHLIHPYASSIGLSVGFGTGYYSPYYGGFGYYSPLSYYNSYYAWNNFYNPYYGGVVIVNGKNNTTPAYTRMSNFNPTAYQGNYYNARPSTQFHQYTIHGRNSTNTIPAIILTGLQTAVLHLITAIIHPCASSPSNFSGGGGGGGGGASRGGGFSRPGR